MEATLVPRALPGPSARGKGGSIVGRAALTRLPRRRPTPPAHAYVSSDPRRHVPTEPGDVLYADAAFIVDAHEKLVSALNPHATERLEEDLLIEIATLQSALDDAARDAAEAEEALRGSLEALSELEAEAARLSAVFAASSSTSSEAEALAAAAAAAKAAAAATVPPPPAPAAVARPSIEEERHRRDRQKREKPSPPSSSPSASLAAAGLSATLELSPRLREFWHPVAFSRDVRERKATKGGGNADDGSVTFDLFDARWNLYRDEGGDPVCVLSATHGASAGSTWPDAPESLPTRERDGLVWAWPGSVVGDDGEHKPPPPSLPTFAAPPEGYTVHAELTMDVPVDAALLLENLLDLAHAPFTHTTTFARGWPVPDAVKFKARQALGGAWDPYPIDMAYAPPCGTLSLIGMRAPGAVDRSGAGVGGSLSSAVAGSTDVVAGGASSGCSRHLYQMHVVLPAGPGRSRLLYRMCLDFWPWAAKIPLASELWRVVADRVLGEDLVLVAGQQDRLLRGGDVWANPVPYDKLGVRCRRWRNAVAAGDERAARLAMASPLGGVEGATSSGLPPEIMTMSAGEMMFSEE